MRIRRQEPEYDPKASRKRKYNWTSLMMGNRWKRHRGWACRCGDSRKDASYKSLLRWLGANLRDAVTAGGEKREIQLHPGREKRKKVNPIISGERKGEGKGESSYIRERKGEEKVSIYIRGGKRWIQLHPGKEKGSSYIRAAQKWIQLHMGSSYLAEDWSDASVSSGTDVD